MVVIMKKINIKYIEYIILIIVVLIISLPLFKTGFIDTHDGHYHIMRIFGTIAGIQDGQFLPEVVMQWGNGFGFSWNLFYPPLVTYIGALFKLILPTYTIAMKAVLVLLTLISAIGMYKLMIEITGKKKISLLTAIIYITAPYRITDIYVRLAIGEVLTFAFMPILFQGLYNLFNKDGKKDYLVIIGAVGIMLSHNISTLLIAIISIIYVLVNITKLKDKKVLSKLFIDAIFILTIVAFFYGPLLESKMSADYAAFEDGFMMTRDGLVKQVVHIRQLFDNSFKPGRSFELGDPNDVKNELSFAIGLQIIIPLLFVPFVLKKMKKETKKHYLYFLILGLGCVFATTGLFPWKYVPDVFVMIQVPWRLLMPATFLLTIAAGMTIDYEFEDIKSKYIAIAILSILIYIMPYFFNLQYVQTFDENAMINSKFAVVNCSNFEYFPTKARNNMDYVANREDKAIITEGQGKIENENKNGTKMNFEIVENNSTNLKIELPYIYYIGYNATLNGEKINLVESENGFLEINIKENNIGTISIQYTGSTIMNITKIVSFFGIILFIIYCFKDKIYCIIQNKIERGNKVGKN